MPPDYMGLGDDEEEDDASLSTAAPSSSTWSDNSANATPIKKQSRWRTTLSMLGQIGKGYAKGGIGGAAVAGIKQARKKSQTEPGNYGY